MIIRRYVFTLSALLLSATLLAGAGATALGQNSRYEGDPYYGRQRNQKHDKRATKRHQKEEKEALKRHQKEERERFGNSEDLRRHQKQEREAIKRHQKAEKERLKNHRRSERNVGYGDYDRDRDYNRNRRNDGYYGDSSDIRRLALERGYQDGVRAGRDDRARNRRFDYEDHSAYRNATAGYRNEYGDREAYRSSFREGFRRGYDEGYRGYNSDSRTGNGIGTILGEIFGRP